MADPPKRTICVLIMCLFVWPLAGCWCSSTAVFFGHSWIGRRFLEESDLSKAGGGGAVDMPLPSKET